MLRFPNLNATVQVPLFKALKIARNDDESDDEFAKREAEHKIELKKFENTLGLIKLRVRLVDLDAFKQLSQKLRKINAEERARLRDLKKKSTREEWPELYADAFSTEDGENALIAATREILGELLVGISGFEIGEGAELRRVDDITEVPELIKLLELAKWHGHAMGIALDAQRVRGDQSLS